MIILSDTKFVHCAIYNRKMDIVGQLLDILASKPYPSVIQEFVAYLSFPHDILEQIDIIRINVI